MKSMGPFFLLCVKLLQIKGYLKVIINILSSVKGKIANFSVVLGNQLKES